MAREAWSIRSGGMNILLAAMQATCAFDDSFPKLDAMTAAETGAVYIYIYISIYV
jgi:hypothetical protein